jgi:DNA-directed RNA polymerase specialized sigma subunit
MKTTKAESQQIEAQIRLRKDVLTETYEDMKNLIFDTTWKVQRTFGGDIDDLMGQANLLFIQAFDSYDETKAKLTTWIASYITTGLRLYLTKERKQKYIIVDFREIEIAQAPNTFCITELIDEMEQDVHIIVQLFLETPKDVIISFLDEDNHMRHLQGHLKRRIKNRLRQMQWNVKRIKKAFEEIKTIINY